MNQRRSLMVLFVSLLPLVAAAQVPGLIAPDVSPAATVTQQLGLTELSVTYHRPSVNTKAMNMTTVDLQKGRIADIIEQLKK